MADWKQITARIRRARTSKDPAAQLSNLFEKTNDAMAAFELARFFETTGQAGDAGKWYATAAGRFRRPEWTTKAQETRVSASSQGQREFRWCGGFRSGRHESGNAGGGRRFGQCSTAGRYAQLFSLQRSLGIEYS